MAKSNMLKKEEGEINEGYKADRSLVCLVP
jgi:hypothetical protein